MRGKGLYRIKSYVTLQTRLGSVEVYWIQASFCEWGRRYICSGLAQAGVHVIPARYQMELTRGHKSA
jgi:hypothetical protein